MTANPSILCDQKVARKKRKLISKNKKETKQKYFFTLMLPKNIWVTLEKERNIFFCFGDIFSSVLVTVNRCRPKNKA